jgi:peptide/nickel transport system substrate-binding protein
MTPKLNLKGMTMKRMIFALLLTTLCLYACSSNDQQKTSGTTDENRGGVMRIVTGVIPQVLGYPPDMGPQDTTIAFPALEPLMTYANQDIVPFLCDKVDVDSENAMVTFHLKKGIKFHDGSDLTAETVKWNYQIAIDAKNLQYHEMVKSIDVLDNYTLRVTLTEYNNQIIHSLGYFFVISKESFEKNGVEWARVNCVGTGPFKFVEFKRDAHVKWTKFEDYWRKDEGLPYLDGIEVRFIPDPVTASSIMETQQADMWMGPGSQYQRKLVDLGLKRQTGDAGLSMWLMPNYKRADGKWNNKKLREALEYAIDRDALTKAFGFGFSLPMSLIASTGDWGYDPNLKRNYDPEKARRLIKEAGYAAPVKIKILTDANGQSIAAGIKGFLDDAGFDCELDVADAGRYFGSVYSTGWEDLAFASSGTDANFLVTITRWFSPEATVLPNFVKPPELIKMWNEAIKKVSATEQEAAVREMVKYIHDEALICPLYRLPSSGLMQTWVYSEYLKQGMSQWDLSREWVDSY